MSFKTDPTDPFVFTTKKAFLQRVADYVRSGHTRYVMGQVRLENLPGLSDKFNRMYDCFLGKHAASRARSKGMYVAQLIFWYPGEGDQVTWILVVLSHEDGRRWILPTAAEQKWRDAFKDRISLTGYELVQLPKKITSADRIKVDTLRKRVQETEGEERKKIEQALHRASVRSSRATIMTWRYSREREQELRTALLNAIRNKRDDELQRLIQTIWRTLGFSGARDQAKKFRELILGTWKRVRGSDPVPELPKGLGYVRRLSDEANSVKASKLIRKWRKHEAEEGHGKKAA